MQVVLLLLLGGLMHAAQSFTPERGVGSFPAMTTLALGYLLLTAFLAGAVFKSIGLPRLTGYLATGIVVGPHGLGLVSSSTVDDLGIVNGIAIALIALTAGTEMHLRSLRPLFRSILFIAILPTVGTAVLLAAVVYLGRGYLPFLSELTSVQLMAVSGVLAVTLVAKSPAVVVALRDEMDADGPLMRTVLAVVVFGDLLVIVLFALVSSVAQSLLGGGADAMRAGLLLSWEIFGSGAVGLLVGGLLALYLKKVSGSGALFLLTVSFVVAEVGKRLSLDPLIVALAAGMLIRNTTDVGVRLNHEIEAAGLPVYIAFFSVAGATIHLDALALVGPIATALVLVRAAGFLVGARVAATFAGAPEVVRRYAGFGLLPQAGLALALAILFTRAFPDFGEGASALVFGVVAINEVVAPAVFRVALTKSGEAGARVPNAPAAGRVTPDATAQQQT
jgi:Kef-type K+ transport system membrane component KefB